eukprot:327577-Pleurochrysis_carterae.AAC.1
MASPNLQNGPIFWRMAGTLLTQCEEKTILQNGEWPVLQNSLYVMFRDGEHVIPSMYGVSPPILQNGTSWAFPFCKMVKCMTILQNGRPCCRIV